MQASSPLVQWLAACDAYRKDDIAPLHRGELNERIPDQSQLYRTAGGDLDSRYELEGRLLCSVTFAVG